MNFSRTVAVLFAVAALAPGSLACAAVSTFPASVFQVGGTGSGNLVGNTAATARLNRGQTIGLNFGGAVGAVAGARLFLNFTQVSNNTTYLWVRLGNWNGTAFVNAAAAGQVAPNGTATGNVYAQVSSAGLLTVFLDPFLGSCQAIGGCNALVFGNSTFSANGSFFRISSIVAATPEPSAWAMMMLGFAAIAMRLKALRGLTGNSALSNSAFARPSRAI